MMVQQNRNAIVSTDFVSLYIPTFYLDYLLSIFLHKLSDYYPLFSSKSYMYKENLALNNRQGLICHKTTNQPNLNDYSKYLLTKKKKTQKEDNVEWEMKYNFE